MECSFNAAEMTWNSCPKTSSFVSGLKLKQLKTIGSGVALAGSVVDGMSYFMAEKEVQDKVLSILVDRVGAKVMAFLYTDMRFTVVHSLKGSFGNKPLERRIHLCRVTAEVQFRLKRV
jgi:hypothetical protein